MAFTKTVAAQIAYRSGYICNNPECNVLTIGPSISDSSLRSKTGEAAHIKGEKPGAPRFENVDRTEIEGPQNGIWLCAVCHTLIDKNNGVDYPKDKLLKWKLEHEKLISVLLHTHKSPLPLLRRHNVNTKIAQDMVDTLATRGVMFAHYSMEDPTAVITSIKQIRDRLQRCLRQIELDPRLRELCNSFIHSCREAMNENSRSSNALNSYLGVLRSRAGHFLKCLQEEYGCTVDGQIATLLN